eukprot:10940156-Prorocentrum_lima.AAC.1
MVKWKVSPQNKKRLWKRYQRLRLLLAHQRMAGSELIQQSTSDRRSTASAGGQALLPVLSDGSCG